MKLALVSLALTLLPNTLRAEVVLACTFDTIPQAVMTYPDGLSNRPTMQVGARPSVEMIVGQGTSRFESAKIDGYNFQFSPSNSTMDVQSGEQTLRSEVGRCATVGGPVNENKLEIEAENNGVIQDNSEPQVVPSDRGKWKITEDTSQLDDSRTVILSIESNDAIRGQFGSAGPATMFLRCMENTTSAYFVLIDLFLSDIQGFGTVDFRMDAKKAGELRMQVSTDNKALGLWSGGKAIPFIKTLMDGQKVVVRATPFNESAVEFSFDLIGLAEVIKPLQEACKW